MQTANMFCMQVLKPDWHNLLRANDLKPGGQVSIDQCMMKKIPKWKPGALHWLNLGVSPQHLTTAGRVLNLNRGHIPPHYHCIYQRWTFNIESFSPTHWNHMIETGYECHVEPQMDAAGNAIPFPELSKEWISGPEQILRTRIRRERCERRPVDFAPVFT
jgi:hypothetical protein